MCRYLGKYPGLSNPHRQSPLPPPVPPAPPFRVQLYQKALSVKSAIPHPRIMGIVRECGGKMHMSDQLWSEAATDFFEV